MDHHATTPVDPKVLQEMLPYFCEKFGNAGSRNHQFGWEAEAGVDDAREQIARLIGATLPQEIIFTSGATESDNLAIKGVAEAYKDEGNHIVTCATEHKAVLDSCKSLEKIGYRVTFLPVDRFGALDLERLGDVISKETILVSVMAANNEIGTLHPIGEIGRIVKQKGTLFHCDATQGVGKIPIHVQDMGIDLLSLSGHKLYGPKGIGALYVRSKQPKIRLKPIIEGGGQEKGIRSGTLNVPGIIGLGRACQIAQEQMSEEATRLTRLRERLKDGIFSGLDSVYLNGDPVNRIPGNLNVSFAHVDGESLMMGLKEIAVSSGSTCTSAVFKPSYVLKALGVKEDLANASIRFGLGRTNTEEEVDYTVKRVVQEVKRLQAGSQITAASKTEFSKERVTQPRLNPSKVEGRIV